MFEDRKISRKDVRLPRIKLLLYPGYLYVFDYNNQVHRLNLSGEIMCSWEALGDWNDQIKQYNEFIPINSDHAK